MEDAVNFNIPFYEKQTLCVNTFGHSRTSPSHKYGPAVRSYYLIHYILEGRGQFLVNNSTYHLSAGQGFLIEPDYQTTYISDSENPWTYVWVGFSGSEAKNLIDSIGLSQEQPIFKCPESKALLGYITDMTEHNHGGTRDTYRILGDFFLFISTIASSKEEMVPESDGNLYVEQAIYYIRNHYTEPLQVDEIARYVGLNRSYLSTIFKEHTKLTPLQYIQAFRLTKAQHLLESSRLPIASIACSCGYQEPESLIKIFRRRYGMSPSAFRKYAMERDASEREKAAKKNKEENQPF